MALEAFPLGIRKVTGITGTHPSSFSCEVYQVGQSAEQFFPKYQEGQSAKLIAKLEAKPPDLDRIGAAVHLQLASFRTENTLRKPVVIWVVRVGDEL